MTGASPGKRNASRYCLSASSTRRSSKLNDLQQFNTIIICFYTYTWYVVKRSFVQGHKIAKYMPEIRKIPCNSLIKIKRRIVTMPKNHVNEYTLSKEYWNSQKAYLTKASKTLLLDFLATYSPIMALSSLGFSFRNVTTSPGSKGLDNNPCSWRKVIPLIGLVLNCSVPV